MYVCSPMDRLAAAKATGIIFENNVFAIIFTFNFTRRLFYCGINNDSYIVSIVLLATTMRLVLSHGSVKKCLDAWSKRKLNSVMECRL